MAPFVLLLLLVLMLLALATPYRTPSLEGLLAPPRTISRNPFLLVAAIALLVFSAARYFVGTDFFLYTLLFEQVDPNEWAATITNSPQELGFTLLLLVLRSFTENPQYLFAVSALITLLATFKSISNLSKVPALSIFVYVAFAHYLLPMNAIRQGIAIALLYLAVSYYRKSRGLSIFYTLLAATFHTSAIVVAILFLLLRLSDLGKKSIVVGSLILAILARSYLITWDPFVALASRLNPRYATYLENAESTGVGTYLVLIVGVLIALVSTQVSLSNREDIWIRNIFVASIPLIALGTAATDLARVAQYFTYSFVFLAPIMYEQRKKHKTLFLVSLIGLGIVYFFAYLLNYGGLLPYQDAFGILSRDGMQQHVPK